jgi:hypothetical protein
MMGFYECLNAAGGDFSQESTGKSFCALRFGQGVQIQIREG